MCVLSLSIGGNAVNYMVVEGTCSDVDSPIDREYRIPTSECRCEHRELVGST